VLMNASWRPFGDQAGIWFTGPTIVSWRGVPEGSVRSSV